MFSLHRLFSPHSLPPHGGANGRVVVAAAAVTVPQCEAIRPKRSSWNGSFKMEHKTEDVCAAINENLVAAGSI